uniref:Coat protein n=1 Tax=Neopestalotiopsis nebuloides deltaflexivirus 1 TaxID=3162603 RepID=A0AAU7NIP2_9VIRU
MTEINLLGDLSELRASRVNFNIVIEVTGIEGSGVKDLASLPGLAPFLQGRAYASLVKDSLMVQATGDVEQQRAVNVYCAVIPTGLPTSPASAAHVQRVPGSCFVQHSVTTSGAPVQLRFPDGVATQLKPKPVWGEQPALAYYFQVLGGQQTSVARIRLSGLLEVGGIGFVQTW